MNQLSLFSEIPERLLWLKDELAFSLSYDQNKILADIMRLYNEGMPFDVDATYSKGVFWKKLPEPMLKFDIDPQAKGVAKANATHLPLQDGSISSVIFDPPFKMSNSKVKGIIEERFTAYASPEALWEFYWAALEEFYRILLPGGIAVVKCQDVVSSGKNYWSHFEIEQAARKIGFEQLDLFVLGRKSVLMSPNMQRQKHARKNHSFFLVFKRK